MTVRLNITMNEDLYRRLKRELPAKRISWFIEAVGAKLPAARPQALDAAYAAAKKEPWRHELEDDWDVADTEGWPK